MNPIIATRHNDDAMPPEVATAILTEPRARLTNRFRKTAKLARERVFASDVPLHRVTSEHEKNHQLYPLANPAKPTPPADKLKTATIAQLRKWLPRVIARRLVAQHKAVKLESLAGKFEGTKERARLFAISVCEHQAASLDAQRDLLEDEISRRRGVRDEVYQNRFSRPHIDPAVRRRAALHARCGC
jgi:hypothetical protein